jgi:SET domain-containing protein
MLRVETEVKASTIQGLGLFAVEFIPKGKLIAIFPYGAEILSEDEYQNEQRAGNEVIIWSAVRWIGDYFLTGDEIGKEERINHSSDPTMLYHCGLCFAYRDIKQGEELTVDYRHFLAIDDVNSFDDSMVNGAPKIDGEDPTKLLVESAEEIVKLFKTVELS